MTAYVREILKASAPELAGTIAVYRAGYRRGGAAGVPPACICGRGLALCCGAPLWSTPLAQRTPFTPRLPLAPRSLQPRGAAGD